jgi:hypothetical protein
MCKLPNSTFLSDSSPKRILENLRLPLFQNLYAADRAVHHQDCQGDAGVQDAGGRKGCAQKLQKLIRFPVLPRFAYGHQNHSLGGEQRMKPASRVSQTTAQDKKAIRPRLHKIKRILDTVGPE